MKKQTNFQVTIGYRSVVQVQVKADTQKEAEDKALNYFVQQKDKMFKGSLELQDDTFGVHGCLNLDETWNMLYE